jgi:hypothetical protein
VLVASAIDGDWETLPGEAASRILREGRFSWPGRTQYCAGPGAAARMRSFIRDGLRRGGKEAPPREPPSPVARPIARGKMPNRIHVIEDYETDIERRWWLAGRLETENVPPGSSRACRGTLANDYDGKMGDPSKVYTAVIFNPVPGPPMGGNTRLGFRFWLQGTDRLRLQIYSLSRGYHRRLTLANLPQGVWTSVAADMTAARRPDGSGGALAAGERIDDIQFYADPSAELIIDDILLYDAAPPEETAPFPRRPIFSGWFDTGRQGSEWPGDFEIVPHERPGTWKAARSVPRRERDVSWIRVHLRGERPLGEKTELRFRFRYRLRGADSMRVLLVHRGGNRKSSAALDGLEQGRWATAAVRFAPALEVADEVHFLLRPGGELLLDDMLLYDP